MMRLINAEEAIKEILNVYEYKYPTASGAFDHFVTHMIPNILKNMPIVDAELVRHGRWIKDGDFLICLNCESEIDIKNSLGTENHKNYCPNCGAKMVEKYEYR